VEHAAIIGDGSRGIQRLRKRCKAAVRWYRRAVLPEPVA